jgi:hypothetical protein
MKQKYQKEMVKLYNKKMFETNENTSSNNTILIRDIKYNYFKLLELILAVIGGLLLFCKNWFLYTFGHLKRRLGRIKKQKYNGEFHTLPYIH